MASEPRSELGMIRRRPSRRGVLIPDPWGMPAGHTRVGLPPRDEPLADLLTSTEGQLIHRGPRRVGSGAPRAYNGRPACRGEGATGSYREPRRAAVFVPIGSVFVWCPRSIGRRARRAPPLDTVEKLEPWSSAWRVEPSPNWRGPRGPHAGTSHPWRPAGGTRPSR